MRPLRPEAGRRPAPGPWPSIGGPRPRPPGLPAGSPRRRGRCPAARTCRPRIARRSAPRTTGPRPPPRTGRRRSRAGRPRRRPPAGPRRRPGSGYKARGRRSDPARSRCRNSRRRERPAGTGRRLGPAARGARCDRHLVHTGPVRIAGQGHQQRSRLVGRAEQAEPVRAEPGDETYMSQGFHVVHQGGPVTNPVFIRAEPVLRAGFPAIDPRNQGGLLAGDVPARGVDHLHARSVGPLSQGRGHCGRGGRSGTGRWR